MPEKQNLVYADSHHAEICPEGQPLDGQRAVLCVPCHIYYLPVHADYSRELIECIWKNL